MIRLIHRTHPDRQACATLTLPWEKRIRSRLRVELDDGREAGLFLARGIVLRNNDCLASDQGEVIRIRAALETVSSVRCDSALLLGRLCYHLGNRHLALEIRDDCVRYRHDHVIDDMVRRLGLAVGIELAAFEPETGAYGGHDHHHA